MRIAVIGAGVAGLGAAWSLCRRPRGRGLRAREPVRRACLHRRRPVAARPQPVDMGFIVYNERNYPNLVALFDHLGVPTEESDMSFAVSLDGGRFEYGSSYAGYFAQRAQHGAAVVPAHDARHPALQSTGAAPAGAGRGPRLHARRLHRRRRSRRRLPRPLSGADGVLHLVVAARPRARLSGADLRPLLPQSRPADGRPAAALAHRQRRQPVIRRTHRGAAAPPGARSPCRRVPPPRLPTACRCATRPVTGTASTRSCWPAMPTRRWRLLADADDARARAARPLRLFLEHGLAAWRCQPDAAPARGVVELELCRGPAAHGRAARRA